VGGKKKAQQGRISAHGKKIKGTAG